MLSPRPCYRPFRLALLQKGAETLVKSNIKATPFISKFKWAAIAVIVVLFVIEAITTALRAVFPRSVLPDYVSAVVAFIVDVTLVVCYISAAVAIARRIGKRRKRIVRQMTIRITVSSLGYFICIAGIIAFALAFQNVWGRGMTLNAIFVGFNLAGLMQVLALKPAPQHKLKSSSHHTPSNGKSSSTGKPDSDHTGVNTESANSNV